MINETKVADLIADETTLNPAEALMAIRQLRKVLQRLLLDGHSVQLGDWGTFSSTLSSSGTDAKEELTARSIKKININFQAGSDLKAAIQKADILRLDKMMEGKGGTTGGGSEEGPDDL